MRRWLDRVEARRASLDRDKRRRREFVEEARQKVAEARGWSLRGRNARTRDVDRVVRLEEEGGRPGRYQFLTVWHVRAVAKWLDYHYREGLHDPPEGEQLYRARIASCEEEPPTLPPLPSEVLSDFETSGSLSDSNLEERFQRAWPFVRGACEVEPATYWGQRRRAFTRKALGALLDCSPETVRKAYMAGPEKVDRKLEEVPGSPVVMDREEVYAALRGAGKSYEERKEAYKRRVRDRYDPGPPDV